LSAAAEWYQKSLDSGYEPDNNLMDVLGNRCNEQTSRRIPASVKTGILFGEPPCARMAEWEAKKNPEGVEASGV